MLQAKVAVVLDADQRTASEQRGAAWRLLGARMHAIGRLEGIVEFEAGVIEEVGRRHAQWRAAAL